MNNSAFDNFWRPAYEGYSALTFLLSALCVFVIGRTTDSGFRFIAFMSIPLLCFAVLRGYQAYKHWLYQAKLNVVEPMFTTVEDVIKAQPKDVDAIYIGQGFEWDQEHAQTMHSISALSKRDFAPPQWFLNFYRKFRNVRQLTPKLQEQHSGQFATGPKPEACAHDKVPSSTGKAFIHGCHRQSDMPLYLPRNIQRGHVGAPGSTGAGKGVQLILQIIGCVARGHSVIIFDPKPDDNIRNACYAALLYLGRPEAFFFFSAAKPDCSVRIDPMANYTDSAELATRLACLMVGSGDSQVYKEFAHSVSHSLAEALITTGTTPSLVNIRKYTEGGVDNLLIRLCETHFEINKSLFPSWRIEVQEMETRFDQMTRGRPSSPRAAALCEFYRLKVLEVRQSVAIDGLVKIYTHDNNHYRKMVASFITTLDTITSGPIRGLLSPDYDDPLDTRPIVDLSKVVRQGSCLYIGLNSLADSVTGSRIGSLFFSDLVAVVASQYYFHSHALRPVTVFTDEGAEIINEQTIRMLNKARGANFAVHLAIQTSNDVTVRLGSDAYTKLVFGNLNNLICGRIFDEDTIKVVSSRFGFTKASSLSDGHSTATYSHSEKMDYSGGHNVSREWEEVERVNPDLFPLLPDCEFFATLNDGRHVKMKVPIVEFKEHEKFVPSPYIGRANDPGVIERLHRDSQFKVAV